MIYTVESIEAARLNMKFPSSSSETKEERKNPEKDFNPFFK